MATSQITPSTSRAPPESTPPRSKRARQALQQPKEKKDVRCNIHGSIKLEPLLVAVMDSPIVQRLRRLKQLGITEYVYPTANHSRFEHSLGVAHLAAEMCKKLGDGHIPASAEKPSERDILCVKLAGLLHDIGHGPFSHSFEKLVDNFKHEDMSKKLLRILLTEQVHLSDFSAGGEKLDDEKDMLFIEELIDGAAPKDRKGRPREKWYLYNIIANKASGVDVDRIDYLLRDAKCATGRDANFDWNFILDNAAVRMAKCDDDPSPYPVIAFARKSAVEIWKIFQSRYDMFNQAYLHQCSIGREMLLSDLLREFKALPEPACHVIPGKTVDEAAADPHSFIKLDDEIITRIIMRVEDCESAAASTEERAKLARIQGLLERYSRHSHYTKLGEHPLPSHLAKRTGSELQRDWKLDATRFRVCLRTVHHGDGDMNPMQNMRFFDPKRDGADEQARPLSEEEWKQVPTAEPFARTTVCVYFRGDEGKDWDSRSQAIDCATREMKKAWRAAGFPDAPTDTDEDQPPSSQGM